MHPHFVPIDAELLRHLYVDEGLTADAIAVRFNCAAITIWRRLRRFRIRLRPRGPQPLEPRSPLVWSPEMAYVVGLMATDGNLARSRWGLSLASNDKDLLETVRQCLSLRNAMTPYTDSHCYHIQWRDRHLYTWLLAIGLTPAKSLTLGPLNVPDEYFADFVRGCVDGDGTVLVYTDRYHAAKRACYVYERLYVSLASASRPFLDWVRAQVSRLVGPSGAIRHDQRAGRSTWTLRYAKADSIRVLRWIYYTPDIPCLYRKRAKAERFLSPLGISLRRPVGRPRVGWLYNNETKPNGPGWCNGSHVALKTPCP
jgi:hypothetical protein